MIRDLFPKPPSPRVWARYERAIEEIESQRIFTRRSINETVRDHCAVVVAVRALRDAELIVQVSPSNRRPQTFRLVGAA